MYVKSLHVRNLRCFVETSLTLHYPGRDTSPASTPTLTNINLLLGNNGAGKTTTLKAIALALLAPVIKETGYVPYQLVRRGSVGTAQITAEVLLHEQDTNLPKGSKPLTELMTTRVSRIEDLERLESDLASSGGQDIWKGMYNNDSPAFLIVGYGATRRVEDIQNFSPSQQQKMRFLRYQRVAGLFESHIALTPLVSWLPNFERENPGRYKQVYNLINRLLPEGASFTGSVEKGEYLFNINGSKAPFGALSDGYRAYIGWITDLLYHVCMGAPNNTKLVDNRGVVLVDEIDLHLHPEWQRTITGTVSRALPNLQFVFSTHSPIVAGSLNKENIFVMEVDESGASIVKQYDERIYGLDADQVLLSSYFNLQTTRAPGFVDEIQELSRNSEKGDSRIALAIMQKLSGEESAPPFMSSGSNGAAKTRNASAKRSRSTATNKASTQKKSKRRVIKSASSRAVKSSKKK